MGEREAESWLLTVRERTFPRQQNVTLNPFGSVFGDNILGIRVG